jgi:hypothetical protein
MEVNGLVQFQWLLLCKGPHWYSSDGGKETTLNPCEGCNPGKLIFIFLISLVPKKKYSYHKALGILVLYSFCFSKSTFQHLTLILCGPGSSVSIATGYGLDGPGIKSWWWQDFLHLSRPALGPTQPPVQWVPGLSQGYKVAGAWCWPLPPF